MTKRKKAGDSLPIEQIDLGIVTTWPLNQLAISPLNVRKIGAIEDIEPLVEDIAAKGLLQSLIVHPGPAGSDDPGRLVAGGQRRYLALCRLAKAGRIAEDAHIPVRDVPEEMALEVSLAENLQRRDMNPADEAIAFKALLDSGIHDAGTVAARFGFDRRYVQRRARIAVIAEPLLEALKEGEITIDVAEAYASTDSHDLQLKIYKQIKKDSWRGHNADTVRQLIRYAGISANSAIGKWIGGTKAYQEAGGQVQLDDAFGPLFYDKNNPAKEDAQLRDGAIVSTLISAAKARDASKAMKLATKEFPFVSGYAWAGNLTDEWNPNPAKPGKDSGQIIAKANYDIPKDQLLKRVKKAAEKHGAVVWAVIQLDNDGKLKVSDRCFLVGKDGWEKTKPKQRSESYHSMTDEERAALRRQQEIESWQAKLLGRSLLGETPGFGVTRCYVNHQGGLELELVKFETPFDLVVETKDQWQNTRRTLNPIALAPFLEEATKRVDEAAAAAEAQRAEAEAKKAENDATKVEELKRLELTAIADWPFQVTIDLPDHAASYTIGKTVIDGVDMLECIGPDGDVWESNNVLETVQLIRDAVAENDWTIEIDQDPPADAPGDPELEQQEEAALETTE